MDQFISCPKCSVSIVSSAHFCPNCGFRIAPETVSIGRQVWIYFVSIFLPPLGFIWTCKYLFKGTQQQKRIAYIAALLTVIATIVTVWLTFGFIQSVQSQLNAYQSIGF